MGKKKTKVSKPKEADVYEFTFDPTEEAKLPKKKPKKPAVKKQNNAKPKALPSYKRVYDQNISKALSALRKAIKPSQTKETVKLPQIQETCNEITKSKVRNGKSNVDGGENAVTPMNDTGKASVHELNYPSIRIEDIAADIEPSVIHHENLNYSPVNSPRPQSRVINSVLTPLQSSERVSSDPLNLQPDVSFFDDVPVANSSMIMSVRDPLASPWRVEFGSLPIKWHSNTYMKANMTPAVESSFICTEDHNKKKHVYTNMLGDISESLPQVVSDTPVLKQTSILSFIREVAEKKAKKKRGRSVSPTKAMTVDFTNKNVELNVTSEEQTEKVDNNPISPEEVSRPIDTLNETDNSKEERKMRKRKNDKNVCKRPTKSPHKQKDKDCTYFGFDDSEDQENLSPSKLKVKPTGRSLRLKGRAVLQEINGPTRAALPTVAKSKVVTSADAVNKVYEGLKSAAEAPVFPEKNVESNLTNLEDLAADDSQSVHLFEDIEVVHHLKPIRKSYGKPKRVTFRQPSNGHSTEGITGQDEDSSFEDDLADLTFEVPDVQEKKKAKKRPKKLMSKKEEKEAEEWAAGFNSMCEEIEQFPLMVE
ncbi:unnamed protein product [Arctia plantaginis]|uniref:Uncharacterized protein n=1 Tax=Arctia plantaginis TaxID=874455 RepID=A0A8S1ALK8_ARCPL|nr:unnamed protein product [Arctia plantaginis]